MGSRFEKYRMKDGVTPLAASYFNPVLQDVDTRITDLEAGRQDYDTAIAEVRDHGLARITDALDPRLAEADATLQALDAGIAALPTVASEGYVDAGVAAGAAAHLAAVDPHTQYLTPARHGQILGNPHGTTATQVGAEPALGAPAQDGMVLQSSKGGARAWVPQGNPLLFVKLDPASVAFVKTGASTLAVKAGVQVMIGTRLVAYSSQTAVVMPALVAGTDYAIYACTDGTCRADASFSAPAGYDTTTSRLIGGFHYGLVAPGTTPASGGFNTVQPTRGTGSMAWAQADVDAIAGINAWSLWDLKFRPACANPRGMALVCGSLWVDLYLLGVNHHADGTSKAGAAIACYAAPPKVHPLFGGDGIVTYGSLTWFEANEILAAHGKALLSPAEFAAAAWGVTEAISLTAGATTTGRANGFTSRYGLEQATGIFETWGGALLDGALASVSTSVDDRGSIQFQFYGVVLGGGASAGWTAGSRHMTAADAQNPQISVAVRGRANHLQLL